MKKGDRIRLTRRYAATLMKTISRTRQKVNWIDRCGTVVNNSRTGNSDVIKIVWDGNGSPEYMPIRALELAPPSALSGAQ